ncbi:MAG: xylulokinase [Planctomycetes bacterium]|nr:xylulokinase [Planctomycetota bacterium]
MTVFLGLDVGTQGVKALLLETGHGVVGTASRPLSTIGGLPPGHSEQRPSDWLDAVRGALADLRAQQRARFERVTALAVSGQQHGLVALDAHDRVLRPAMLWNDVRCATECSEILAALGGRDRAFARLGLAALPPGFTAGKVRWLFRHEPEHYAKLARVLLPHDYVNLWLTGEFVAEAGDASGTGWFDVRARQADELACEACAPGLFGKLAPLRAAGTPAGTLRDAIAAELGLPQGALVALGGGDNMMAAIGAGAVEPGIATLSLGTSGTVFAAASQPVCDPAGEIAPFCDSAGGWLPLGCTMNATVATETARALFGLDLAQFDAAVRSVPDGADGVLCLPYFTGERSPDLPTATGAFVGLTPRTSTAPHLARAAMEGASYALIRLLDRLRELGLPLRELRLTGGGSKSRVWCGVIAAASGLPTLTGVHPDAAAVGAAVQAAWTAARVAGAPEFGLAACRARFFLDRELERLPTDATAIARHAAQRRRWQSFLEALAPRYAALAP